MTRRVVGRALGYLLLAAASCWAAVASAELARLSPVLWPLVLPWLAATGLPAAAGAVAAPALLRAAESH
ncbi:MAG: hypothetical protein HYT81_01045 [Gemmatimonadetes bacterium]|nr:hypothetical protein [Gemmatimonadota bacterium]MBI3082028.1 hypothetical protein [Gemmatimonadota bacterium]